MLSAVPTVVGVEVSGSNWSSDFVEYLASNSLGTNGYAIPTGSSSQTKALPWSNINRIHIQFSEDVFVDENDLFVSGVNNAIYDFSNFSYDLNTFEAIWTLSGNIDDDILLLDLASDGLDPVRDLSGNALDGEWIDNSTSGASGNGTAGGDFEFTIAVNVGDFNQSGAVDYGDYYGVYNLLFHDTTSGSYTPFADITGSGAIDSSDLNLVYANFYDTTPNGTPAGAGNEGPTSLLIPAQEIFDPSTDVNVSLYAQFEDAEDSDSALVYSIASVSDSSLFDSVSINQSTGNLVINTASGAQGRAVVEVTATDTNGFATQSQTTVDVARRNAEPTIAAINCEFRAEYENNSWQYYYDVSAEAADEDDNLVGFAVEFSDALSRRVVVGPSGIAVVTVTELQSSTVTAKITDPTGAWHYQSKSCIQA